MTTRDRLVVMAIALLVALGAGWLLVVSPKRKEAAKLGGEVSTASSHLQAAEGSLAGARAAQERYSSAYASIVNLGKAVPPGREVPSLLYELAQASDQKHVDLSSVVYGAAGGPSSSASATQAAASTVAGFTQMPFTFVFNGSFSDLYSLVQQLNRHAMRTASGDIKVSGRLLTIQGAKLAPNSSELRAGASSSTHLTGTIAATAYVLPASQGLTAGATPSSPTGGSARPTSSSSSGGSSPTAPAIARVTP
jgi:Tfp pilus assembly protein PilO